MDFYDLGPIAGITEDTGGRRLHGFNVICVSAGPSSASTMRPRKKLQPLPD